MIETVTDLFIKYPQFYSLHNKKFGFQGTFMFENIPYTVQLDVPNFPKITNFKCILLNSCSSLDITENKEINQDWNIKELLDIIPKLWKKEHSNFDCKNEIEQGKEVLNVLNQILECERFTKDVKMYVNEDLDAVKFDNFNGYEGHYLELSITGQSIGVKDHSLPNVTKDWKLNNNIDSYNKSLFRSETTIAEHLNKFLKLLESFDLLYKNIYVIDELCWVVEPANITTKHNWRMFKLAEKVFIKVILNPFCPNTANVNIYGNSSEVEKYRKMYEENIYNWDSELDVYNNLLKTFDLMLFPCQDTTINLENESDDCCKICLCYHDEDGRIPICSCDNIRCETMFHVSCLKKWLMNSAEGRTFLDVAVGVCPFCKEKISASFRTLLED